MSIIQDKFTRESQLELWDKFKKMLWRGSIYVIIAFVILLTILASTSATEFNLPSCWVLSDSGVSIDANCDGVIDASNYANSVNSSIYYNQSQINSLLALKLNSSDQRFNDTSLILSVNSSIYSKFSNYYNKSESDSLLNNKLNVSDQRYNETSLIVTERGRIDVLNTTKLTATATTCSAGTVSFFNGTGFQCVTDVNTGNITGSGNANSLAKFSSGSVIGSSSISDDGSNVNISSSEVNIGSGITYLEVYNDGFNTYFNTSSTSYYNNDVCYGSNCLSGSPTLTGKANLVGGNNFTGTQTISSGSLGIGITNPSTNLQVIGTVRVGNEASGIGTPRLLVGSNESTTQGLTLQSRWDSLEPNVTLGFYGIRSLSGGTSAQIEMRQTDYQNNALVFSTESTNTFAERMRIHTNGNLGVGVTSPNYSIHTSGMIGFNGQVIGFNDTANYLKSLNNAGNNHVKQFFQASDYSWDIGTSPKMVLDSSGRLGVGTTSPSYAFHIKSPNALARAVLDTGNSTTKLDASWSWLDNGNFAWTFNKDTNNNFEVLRYVAGSYTNKPLIISNANSDITLNTNGIWKGTGSVGIGTTSPTQLLDIEQNNAGNVIGIEVRNTNTTNTASGAGIRFYPTTDTWGAIIFSDRSGAGGSIGGLAFGTSGASDPINNIRMVIDNVGNVGIGTKTPSQKLEVNGTIKTNLTGTGNAFVCVDTNGVIYRSATACA